MIANSSKELILSVIPHQSHSQIKSLLKEIDTWLEGSDVRYKKQKRSWVINACDRENLLTKVLAWRHNFEHIADINICNSSFLTNQESPALFVFDLDSTLIQMEVIDELGRLAGVYAQMKVAA